jgi:hypothetical protein
MQDCAKKISELDHNRELNMNSVSRRLLVAASIAVSVATVVSSCSSEKEPSIPKATGPNASIALEVDCGTDGVGVVDITYGVTSKQVMVARNVTSRSVGAIEKFSNKYGASDDGVDATLTVSTRPTTGTCKTSLTDYNSGDILAEKETAGKAEFTVLVPSD